jgi:hypothetical protein
VEAVFTRTSGSGGDAQVLKPLRHSRWAFTDDPCDIKKMDIHPKK